MNKGASLRRRKRQLTKRKGRSQLKSIMRPNLNRPLRLLKGLICQESTNHMFNQMIMPDKPTMLQVQILATACRGSLQESTLGVEEATSSRQKQP